MKILNPFQGYETKGFLLVGGAALTHEQRLLGFQHLSAKQFMTSYVRAARPSEAESCLTNCVECSDGHRMFGIGRDLLKVI